MHHHLPVVLPVYPSLSTLLSAIDNALCSEASVVATAAREAISAKYGSQHCRAQLRRYARDLSAFLDIYGDGPVLIVSAPARIELCGAHLDRVNYFQGKVLTFASREYDTLMIARPRRDDAILAQSLQAGFPPREFSLDEFIPPSSADAPERTWLDYLDAAGTPEPDWINYLKGSAFYLKLLHPEIDLHGADLLVDSTIPPSGGASSSTALVMASSLALRLLNGLPTDSKAQTLEGAKAEWYVGTRGGMTDHATMAFGRADHALLVTFHPFNVLEIAMPASGYRWLTFYAHPAGVTPEVLAKENEISAVTTTLMPNLIDEVVARHPDMATRWSDFRTAVETCDAAAVRDALGPMTSLLEALPESLTIEELRGHNTALADQVVRTYPALVRVRGTSHPVRVRAKASYHFREAARVVWEADALQNAAKAGGDDDRLAGNMRYVGQLLGETHEGLSGDYEMGTQEVSQLVSVIRQQPGVLGQRMIGLGLGGNILTLVEEDRCEGVIEAVQERYYGPRGRDGVGDQHALVHTPGPGLAAVDLVATVRERLVSLSNRWRDWDKLEDQVIALALSIHGSADLADYRPAYPIKPLIIAGGQGMRARMRRPKVLAEIGGKACIEWLLETIASIPGTETPLLIVSDHEGHDLQIRQHLAGRHEVEFSVESDPQGTGHAVLQSQSHVGGYVGTFLVALATQALIRRDTILKSLLLHEASASAMTLPTTSKPTPYAYLQRDTDGFVCGSRETRLENAPPVDYGEDNIGLFLVRSEAMFPALRAARSRALDADTGRYRMGQLGFPNEMVASLYAERQFILSLCMADPREAESLKYADDIPRIEGHLNDLADG